MGEIILKAEDIYLQNIVQMEVEAAQPGESDITIYNRVVNEYDIDSLETATKAMQLIHLNQSILNFEG
ncbi:MAG: hypothetical protein UIM53_02865 [Acutalibacteraceae bacterium]|nr:hypothetical protein [Acutalibacteraceae bacterium]